MSIRINSIAARTASRREFLAGLAATGFAAVTGNAFAAADPYGGFRMGAQSYSFRAFSFPDAVKKLQELGLKHIELYPGHVSHEMHTPSQRAESKKILDDAGVSADSYGVVPFKAADERGARRVFDFAKEFGLRAISCDPAEDSFDMLDKLVAEYDIPVAIHNHGPHHKWGKPEVILAAVKDHDKRIGLCADTGHFLRADVDPVAAIKILKGRVYGFHIKDFVSEEKEVIAGDGKLDIKALLIEARAQNFNGACSLEFELDEKDPVPGMAKGLENFKKAVAAL